MSFIPMEWRWYGGEPRAKLLGGHNVPEHVSYVQQRYDPLTGEDVVEWINRDGSRHEFRLPSETFSDEVVTALITAMKLSQ